MSKTLGFLRLQDASGQIQVVVRSSENDGSGGKDAQALLDRLQSIPLQSVLSVRGTVLPRREGTINAAMPTGEVEVELQDFAVLNEADRDLPFQPHDAANLANDALRSRYRYLDLRRPELARNIQLRSRVARTVRDHLHKCGFDEVETPVLLRSTPEGAAEFLVPTRTSKIKGTNEPLFYALPQSPQQPKQLLIASGCVDKYYQFAKCFRDEDSRKDRQVEFTQIDLEMGFVSQSAPSAESDWRMGGSEVREVVEGMVSAVWQEVKGIDFGRLPVITYEHAMATYGSDKPDRRFGMQIQSISSALRSHDGEAEAPASVVEMIVSPSEGLSNSAVKALTATTGVEHFKAKPGSPHELAALLLKKSSHVAGYLRAADLPATEVDVEFLAKRCNEAMASEGSACHVFVASRPLPSAGGSTKLGDLRLALAAQLESTGVTVRRDVDDMFWVTEFPLFTQEEGGEWSSTHHPFTAPLAEDLHLLEAVSDEQIAKIRGQHYDLVLNGTEIGGGSVRIHRAELQEKVMRDVLGLSDDERKRFAHLLHALRCGAPPHGGIALGEYSQRCTVAEVEAPAHSRTSGQASID